MRIKPLTLKDLTTLADLKAWLRKSVKFHKKYEVTDEHLLIYLDYIAEQVKNAGNITKQAWLNQIAELKQRIGTNG